MHNVAECVGRDCWRRFAMKVSLPSFVALMSAFDRLKNFVVPQELDYQARLLVWILSV